MCLCVRKFISVLITYYLNFTECGCVHLRFKENHTYSLYAMRTTHIHYTSHIQALLLSP